ncbi:hypothetical protein X777_04571 [Ooceraea biroi]|uniref:Uncharacterized protein n=1 Tax=Ooceraea biroi TaxID=2015173 RepID=A0A026WHP5_OOCBI|nr:hypothetical protein X777_04571 [Ooceraea biroi]
MKERTSRRRNGLKNAHAPSLCPARSCYRVGKILLSQPRDGESPMREHKGPPARPPSERRDEREDRR